jgi:hypothetical protein
MIELNQARLKAGEVTSSSSPIDSATTTSKDARSMSKKSVPWENLYRPYECNPHRHYAIDFGPYCFHSDDFRSESMWAINWANYHTSRSDRRPVPFPGLGDGGGGTLAMLPHTTYVVTYSGASKNFIGPVRKNKIWKYGITSVPHYQSRANVGRSACNAYMKKHHLRQDCTRTWVAVNLATFGWDNARYLEASLIKEYERSHGQCPPGQRISCR